MAIHKDLQCSSSKKRKRTVPSEFLYWPVLFW